VGFLAVVGHGQRGVFGGLLRLNVAGGPLEFHCTAPVKPNRAQEILFGPTLEPYLFGEQIGRALVTQCQGSLEAVLTDQESVLAAREFIDPPMVLVRQPVETVSQDGSGKVVQLRFDQAHTSHSPTGIFRIGRNTLATAAGFSTDETVVASKLATIGDRFDLWEPFSRIREAIEEAQRSGR